MKIKSKINLTNINQAIFILIKRFTDILPSKNILVDLYRRKKVTLNPTQLVSLVQLSIDSLSKDGLSFIDEHKIIECKNKLNQFKSNVNIKKASKGNLQNLTVIGNTLTKYSSGKPPSKSHPHI